MANGSGIDAPLVGTGVVAGGMVKMGWDLAIQRLKTGDVAGALQVLAARQGNGTSVQMDFWVYHTLNAAMPNKGIRVFGINFRP